MDIKQLFDDDRAVSPVIGVILMVAITVILAAVIGTFVLGLGDQVQSTTPQASFGFDTENDQADVVITHETGDTIEAADVKISATADYEAESGNGETWGTLQDDDGEVSAGDSVTITYNTTAGESDGDWGGETVRVVYNNPDSDSSSTLGKFEVPE